MKLVFFGTGAFAVPSLEALVATRRHAIACVTQPDRPQGRGLQLVASPVHAAAVALGIPVETPEELASLEAAWQRQPPDLGVVIDYGRLIRPGLLQVPRLGWLGVHPSLLPKYRGASPVAWTILSGDTETGVTIFRLNERMDAGDVLAQERVAIGPRETAPQLLDRLAIFGARVLVRVVDRLAQGERWGAPQVEAEATEAPKLTKAMGRIRWSDPAPAIDRLVRAMNAWPGASTTWRGQIVRIWESDVEDEAASSATPGAVAAVSPEGLVVHAGQGRVAIRELQLEGRRRMRVREFLAGHPVTVGERLGSEQANVEGAT